MPGNVERSCTSCRHFKVGDGLNGACHRYPPAFAGESSPRENHHWRFPVVSAYDWCGEYRLRDAPQASS